MKLARKCAALAALGLITCGSAAMANTTFTTGQASGGNWQTLYVQGFSPSVAPTPNPGSAAGDTVTLSQFQFFKSGNEDTASNIRLAIIDNIFPSSPTVTGITTTTAHFVGLSTNTIANTSATQTNPATGLNWAVGDAETFAFNNLPLIYGNNYAAMFVNVGTDPGNGSGAPLTPILVSTLAANFVETPPGSGTFLPTPNYGGDNNFNLATSNFINGGFFSTFSHGGDAVFNATLTATPEPGSLMLGTFGLMALGARRRLAK
jgi:PEP-CTERM motif